MHQQDSKILIYSNGTFQIKFIWNLGHKCEEFLKTKVDESVKKKEEQNFPYREILFLSKLLTKFPDSDIGSCENRVNRNPNPK